MNRMEEYQNLLAAMEQIPPETAGCVERARSRRSRKRLLWRPLASAAAVFAVFVGLVNLSPTVAAACREIPLLEKLTEAVVFSPSLQKAVENDYVQPIGLEETKNSITVRVEHVIVDQKQVNIFYTVASERYDFLTVSADVWKADADEGVEAGIVFGDTRVTHGAMRHITVDMADGVVPSQMRLLVDVYAAEKNADAEEPTHEQWTQAEQTEPVAAFAFLLTFDPTFTEQGRISEPNQTMDLDGNLFTITELGIYPSHIRIGIAEDPDNPCWIRSLRFHLELEDGTIIEAGSAGITAYGNEHTPSMTTYMAESTYFYEADRFRLVVTGADFLEKDFGMTYVNLETQDAENMPAGWVLESTQRVGDNWELKFLYPDDGNTHSQIYTEFYDAEGNRLSTDGMWWSGGEGGTIEAPVMRDAGYRLKGFNGTEVWLQPNYNYFWYPEEPVIVEIEP